MRLIRKEGDKNAAEEALLNEKLWNTNMFIDKTEQQIKKTTTEKQDMMVDENILKLELRRLRNVLNQKADDVMRFGSLSGLISFGSNPLQ